MLYYHKLKRQEVWLGSLTWAQKNHIQDPVAYADKILKAFDEKFTEPEPPEPKMGWFQKLVRSL